MSDDVRGTETWIDAMATPFERAWREGRCPRIEDYVAGLGEPRRSLLLEELLCVEREIRRVRGEAPRPEEYRSRFPGDGAAIAAAFAAAGGGPKGTVEGAGRRIPSVGLTGSPGWEPPGGPGSSDRTDPFVEPVPGPPAEGGLAAGGPASPDYDILGELGRGGMGVVYRAFDRRRQEMVALKTLRRPDAAALIRFKREFRALADVAHPNLVSLYELVSDGRSCFFTMELVPGVDFLSYVRSGVERAEADTLADREPEGRQAAVAETELAEGPESLGPGPGVRAAPGAGPGREPGLTPFQLGRLRGALRQLAEGVAVIHAAGQLHRDIKPTNVLVTRRGRVVLLDFGLAAELGPSGLHQSTEPHVLGTVAYMAPEQAAGLPTSPASDWYGVGSMLYEALTGRLPFLGRPLEVLMDKQRYEPPPPRQLVPDVPEDLDVLCRDLLRRTPEARPSGRDLLRRLGGSAADPGASPARPSSGRAVRLVGREPHLAALAGAFADVERGETVAVHVHGPSGAGKSALVRAFLDDLTERDGAVVLAGRCYERESVPYKALDGVVDALGRHLGHLPQAEVAALLPRDARPLARIFPALQRAAAASELRHPPEALDPRELRRRGFAALRELLARLGDRRPLVLAIDDLQWGDLDSAALLSELLRPPDPPVLLLLASYRSEDAATSPLLRVLIGAPGAKDVVPVRRELAVGALPGPEAAALAAELLGAEGRGRGDLAEAIARESGGNPFFIAELVRHLQSGTDLAGRPTPAERVNLDEVLWGRVARLPEEARRLLEVISVAGRPLGAAEAGLAADLRGDERASMAILRAGRFVRGTGPAENPEVEAYHDRVRETVVDHLLPVTLRSHHSRLALALEASGRGDPEALAVHFLGAGEHGRAAGHFAAAAARAAGALAFDRAAQLYRLALSPGLLEPRVQARLRARLGDALANAGRGAEAAREYLSACEGASSSEVLDLQRRAAMQFLISGHVEEGHAVVHTVLNSVGMRLPPTPRRALLSLLCRRAQLRLRGYTSRVKESSELSTSDTRLLDATWSVGVGLTMFDPIRGFDLQTRNLMLALDAGEPRRIARALALEAINIATEGGDAERRVRRILDTADTFAQRVADPHAMGLVSMATGIAALLVGRWQIAREYCDKADSIFRDRCTGVAWELDTTQIFRHHALYYMGEVAELSRRLPIEFKEAQERGDLYLLMTLGTFSRPFTLLAADAPQMAREELSSIMERWQVKGFYTQHVNFIYRNIQIDIYQGDGASAWRRIAKNWTIIKSSNVLRIQAFRIYLLYLRASSAIAAADTLNPGPLLRSAEHDAWRLEREGMTWSLALSRLIRAGIAATRGEGSNAVDLLTSAMGNFESIEMRLHAAVARRRLGQLIGGDVGGALIGQAETWLTCQGILNATRMAAMVAPWDQS